MIQNEITITHRARYYISENKNYKNILYVLHGYGQLAQFFIRKFQAIHPDYLVIAPEAMHRFYLHGSSGRVGASWMTKEARLLDIENNIHYLNQLDQHLSTSLQFEKKVVLGFSQGGATAARWVEQLKNLDHLILWASVYPPDLSIENPLNSFRKDFLVGNEDEYYSKNEQIEICNTYQKMGFNTQIFNGKHNIDIAILNQLLTSV